MYTIDGVPLSDPHYRWRVHRETQRRTPVAFRSVDVDVPGVDGNIPIYGENVEATALALELNVYGSPEQVEERVNFLRSLLGRTTGPLHVGKRGGLVAEAKPAAISDPVMVDHYARLSVTLSIPSGVWRGAEETWTHPAPASSAPVATPIRSSRPITDSLILITGPANTPIVEDAATGATVRYGGSVPAGQKLLIDCTEWRANLSSGTTWGTSGSNATSDLDNTGPMSDVTLLTLTPVMAGDSWGNRGPGVPIVPAAGDGLAFTPRIIFRASGTTSATSVQVRARGSFI